MSPPRTHPLLLWTGASTGGWCCWVASALRLHVPCAGLLGGAGDLHVGEKDPTLGTHTLAHN